MFFFELYDDHRALHVLTNSFPTRRSSDLRALPWCSREGGAPSSACGRGCGLRDQALYKTRPHPALRATFSRRREKGWTQVEDGPAGWESGIGKSGMYFCPSFQRKREPSDLSLYQPTWQTLKARGSRMPGTDEAGGSDEIGTSSFRDGVCKSL